MSLFGAINRNTQRLFLDEECELYVPSELRPVVDANLYLTDEEHARCLSRFCVLSGRLPQRDITIARASLRGSATAFNAGACIPVKATMLLFFATIGVELSQAGVAKSLLNVWQPPRS